MELWIRSQDKKRLIKVYDDINIVIDPAYKDWCIETGIGQDYILRDAYYIVTNDINIGIYFDKKRALEVLDEIQRILHPIINLYTPLTESKEDYKNHCMKTELVGYETTYDIVALPTYVYEMPKE